LLQLFHIHQGDFQVTAINGIPVPFTGYQDSVILPLASDMNLGSVTLIFPFNKPYLLGKFVFHCHILNHEDNGMMATVEVVQGCPSITEGSATWALTLPGQTASGNCVTGTSGSPSRNCLSGGSWGSISGSCTAQANNDTKTTGAIVGGVIGGLAGLLVVLVIFWFILRRTRFNQKKRERFIEMNS
jgi:hypothetical protein